MGQPGRVVVGAHVLCYINGQLIGRVAGLDFHGSTKFKEVRAIDVPYVQEFMPTTVGVNFTIHLIRTVGDGGAQGAGIVVQQPYISRAKYFTLLLKDRRTDGAILKVDQCVADDEQWTTAPKNRLLGTVSCRGIMSTNEFSTTSAS